MRSGAGARTGASGRGYPAAVQPDRARPPFRQPARRADADIDALAALAWQVDQAHADVRRAEHVGPALALGVALACLPLLLVLIGMVLQYLT